MVGVKNSPCFHPNENFPFSRGGLGFLQDFDGLEPSKTCQNDGSHFLGALVLRLVLSSGLFGGSILLDFGGTILGFLLFGRDWGLFGRHVSDRKFVHTRETERRLDLNALPASVPDKQWSSCGSRLLDLDFEPTGAWFQWVGRAIETRACLGTKKEVKIYPAANCNVVCLNGNVLAVRMNQYRLCLSTDIQHGHHYVIALENTCWFCTSTVTKSILILEKKLLC